jgi:hypothetical protein
MMGSRNNTNDGSYGVFSRRGRRKAFRPGVVKFVKRLFWKRERKNAHRNIRAAADD